MKRVAVFFAAVLLLSACAPGVGFEPIDVPEWGRSWPTERSPVAVVEEPPVVTRPVVPHPPGVQESPAEPPLPVEPPPAEPPSVEPPGEPEPPVEPPVVTPEPPASPEPPVAPPPEPPAPPPDGSGDGCWTKTLPSQSAVERIEKCPGEGARVIKRR